MPSSSDAMAVLQPGIHQVSPVHGSSERTEREKQSKNTLSNSLSVSASGAKRQGGRGHAEMEMDISKLVQQNGLWCFSQYLLFDPIVPGGKKFPNQNC